MTFIEDQAKTWRDIYKWHQLNPAYPFDETPNGPGSRTDTTLAVRTWLPKLIVQYDIKSMLDAPCGDWTWMCTLHRFYVGRGIQYIGWDVEPSVIELNKAAWPMHTWDCRNLLTVRSLPNADLILCRDFMIHLPNKQINSLLGKIKASGARFLLATNNPGASNDDVTSEGEAGWAAYYDHKIDLEVEPFSLIGKIDAIPECNDWSNDRSWDDKQLTLFAL